MTYGIGLAVIGFSVAAIATSAIGIQAYRDCGMRETSPANFRWMVINLVLAIITFFIGAAILYYTYANKDLSGMISDKVLNAALLVASIASIATSSISIQAYKKCDAMKARPANFKWLVTNLCIAIAMTLVALYDVYRIYYTDEGSIMSALNGILETKYEGPQYE